MFQITYCNVDDHFSIGCFRSNLLDRFKIESSKIIIMKTIFALIALAALTATILMDTVGRKVKTTKTN